jgi:hypothetical protein
MAGIKADARLADDQRIVGEAAIEQRIGHHQRLARRDRVAAERKAVLVDQRDECDRHVERGRREAGELVEALFRGAVEHAEAAQRPESKLFIE